MNILSQRSQIIKYFSHSTVAAPVLLLILLLPFMAQAQVDPQGVRRDPTRPLTEAERQKRLDRDLEEREYRMRILEAGRIEREEPELSPAMKMRMLIADIQRGSDQLQLNNSRLQQAMKAPGMPDYKRISGYASEMRKAALRLQTSLAIPKAEQQEEKPETVSSLPDEQLKASVAVLDRLVKELVGNEILQRPGAVNAQLFASAGQDLRGMLRQTTRVKKLADDLRVISSAQK
jgi:hypothetical protein